MRICVEMKIDCEFFKYDQSEIVNLVKWFVVYMSQWMLFKLRPKMLFLLLNVWNYKVYENCAHCDVK